MSEDRRKRTLDAAIKEGVACSLMLGFGERNLPPLATFIRMPEAVFGALCSLSSLAGGIFQVVGANVVDAARRRKIFFVWGAVVQALSWILVAAAIFLQKPWNFMSLILSQILYVGALNFTIPPWSSVMGDTVAEDSRGRYFGKRNFWVGAGQLAAFTLAAVILDGLKPLGLLSWGFFCLFALSLAARMISVYYLTRMYEAPYHIQPSDRFTLADFVRRAPRANFGRFVFCCTMFIFGVSIAGPFFGYFMLKDLQWSYTEFMIATNVQMIASFVTQPLWGRLADARGNKFVLTLAMFGIGMIPLLWLPWHNKYYLFGVQIYDGLVWSAFQLSANNYIFDAVTPPKRARCTAYFNLFFAGGVFAGSLAGGLLIEALKGISPLAGTGLSHPFEVLLMLSAVGRLGAAIAGVGMFREFRVRPRAPISNAGEVA